MIIYLKGGGLSKNIPRVLPDNLSYELITYEIPTLFYDIKDITQLSWDEMYETFNCGIGMVVIFDKYSNINNLFNNHDDLLHIGYIINK